MKHSIIQLSDIHLKDKNNSLQGRINEIFDSIKNNLSDCNTLLITGDIAFSGSENEFAQGQLFFEELALKINQYSDTQLQIISIPGNHDCQDLTKPNPVRKSLLSAIQNPQSNVESELITAISECQINYNLFERQIRRGANLIYDTILLKVFELFVDEKKVLFYCYNTSFQSILHEIPGKMIFPLNLIDKSVFEISAKLKISCFHHPFHWLTPENNREFKKHILETSDLYFTGHEHIGTEEKISDLKENFVYHFEGHVLQDSGDNENSGFKIVTIDFETHKFSIRNFIWRSNKYSDLENKPNWHQLERGKLTINNPYEISENFSDALEDSGANFSHPYKTNIKLSDIYIYPNLEILNQGKDNSENIVLTINADMLLDEEMERIRLIFNGTENIGKTSLMKRYFKKLHEKNLIPILIEGQNVNSTNIEQFTKLLFDCFQEQYTSESYDDFKRLDTKRIVLIIDDFNKVRLNIKYKGRLLSNLIKLYENVIITGNELMSVEEILIDDSTQEDIYSTFKIFEIKEFGYQLRSKLINRWNILGNESTISEEVRIAKLQNAESIINTVLGVNYVPSYPFFVLTILQSLEIGNPTDLSASTFGYYYSFLIQKSFTNILTSQREITEYENYLSELSYFLYKKSLREFDTYKLSEFDRSYRLSYTISHSLEKITQNLIRAKILTNFGDDLEYRYSYVHYFFLSSYIASNIEKENIQAEISEFTNGLYKSENSNILMFLTHHTKSNFLLDEILRKTNSLFTELAPCKLEDDIKDINKLGEKINDLVFESRSIDEYRDEENECKDSEKNNTEDLEDSNKSKDENEISLVSNLNTSFKAIEIVGQILKNNYGKIENTTLEKLIESSILLGLRALNVFFNIIEENSDYITNQVNSIITEIEKARGRKLDNPKKIEKLSKDTLFGVCNQISYSFIKKISNSIGTEYLNDILEKVYSKNDYSSVKLVKLAIKLDHYKSFPESDIKLLKRQLEKYYLSNYVMKRLVVNHLYLFPTNFKQKDQILSYLNIPIQSQLKIDNVSQQKKK